MQSFAKRLIALRRERGLTQEECAKLNHMQRSTYSGYETEGKEPKFEALSALAGFFGVTTDYLLGVSDSRTHNDAVPVTDAGNLSGRRSYALVTGGARGMGRAISLYLAKNGFTVAALGTRDAENVKDFTDELFEYGDNIYIKCDISDRDDRMRAIDVFYEKYGRLDVLVNNAGIAPAVRADLLDMTEESFDRVMNVNLKGTFFFTQYAASKMINDAPGDAPRCVIITSSISAETSSINRGEYCISKAGLSMTAKLFADRLAPYGINCYEVRPGIIATDMTAGVSEKYQRLIDGGLLPISRMGAPEDAAKAVYGLAMGYFSYATGCVIPVDGGFALSRL